MTTLWRDVRRALAAPPAESEAVLWVGGTADLSPATRAARAVPALGLWVSMRRAQDSGRGVLVFRVLATRDDALVRDPDRLQLARAGVVSLFGTVRPRTPLLRELSDELNAVDQAAGVVRVPTELTGSVCWLVTFEQPRRMLPGLGAAPHVPLPLWMDEADPADVPGVGLVAPDRWPDRLREAWLASLQ